MKHTIKILSLLGLAACGAPDHSRLLEAWNSANNPELVTGAGYVAEFGKLPLKGEATQKGWSDDYWATAKGGIAYRWKTNEVSYAIMNLEGVKGQTFTHQSPAEKFDLLMNRPDFPTVQSELQRTRILKTVAGSSEFEAGYEIPGWEGICHGWAPAALNFKEPKKAVSMKLKEGNQVVFYPSDIKALLSYYQQEQGNRSTHTDFVSERCSLDFADLDKQVKEGKITAEEAKAQKESSKCKDMNAASFHLILANELGLKKLGFVVDVTRDFEVWNQPVNSFRSTIVSESATASEGAAAGTVREVTVRTDMIYTVETAPSERPSGSAEKVKHYQYVLEIDAADKIIGGHWISEDRPDFAWRESTPEFRGYFKALQSIYLKSL